MATALLFILLSLSAALADKKLPLTDFTLANGLRVIVMEDHRAPVVLQAIGYDVGAADEIQGKTGLAHFLEHLLFRGTKRYSAAAFDRLMDDNGVQKNAFTTPDITMYYMRGAAELLPMFMDLESDRMKNLQLDAAMFEVERKVVQEERRQRVGSSPMGAPMEKLDAKLLAPHPYSRPVIGTPEDIASVTVDDVMKFYKQHYRPDAATLIVAGDVDPAQVRILVEQYYGPLKNDGARVKPPVRLAPRKQAPLTLEASDKRLGAPVLLRKYLGPAIHTSSPEERAAFSVLSLVLSGHPQSRFDLELVQRRAIATWAAASYQSSADSVGQMTVYASPAPGTDLKALEKEIDVILKRLAEGGLNEADLALPKQMARASFIYSLDDLAGVGTSLGVGVIMGADMNDLLRRHELIAQVTVKDVVAAARKLFEGGSQATLYMSVQQ
jgi:zinc protease